MADASELIEQAPLQDRDLLLRLSLYFDAFEHRLRQGQGWFIFNAAGGRSHRIARFIQHRVTDDYPDVSAFVVPWRDFALSAYVNEVGLPELVRPEWGALVPPHDPAALAAALTELLAKPPADREAMGRAGRAFVAEACNVDTETARLAGLIEAAVA